jgi:hypothetical protein
MTEPSDMMEGDEGHSPTINLIELFDESDSENESEDIDVGEELHDFLTLTTKGPQLDERMVVLLFNNGVEGSRAFLLYSKQSYQEMLSPISTNKLLNLNQSVQQDIRDIKIYGEYVFMHNLVDENGELNLDAVDPQAYQVYLCSHRREAGKILQAVVRLELNARVAAKQARLTLKSTLQESLELLSNASRTNESALRPSTTTGEGHGQRRVSFNTPMGHAHSTDSPSMGGGI